jgi:hypothetical protein
MSWRERLQCEGSGSSDRSDTSTPSVTSVTTPPDSQQVGLVIDAGVTSRSKGPRFHVADQEGQEVPTRALREIAGLLATAYQRYSAPQRVDSDRPEDSGDGDLANSGTESVHGVVP